jgi:DNA-binding IclR family transcriptional regulator
MIAAMNVASTSGGSSGVSGRQGRARRYEIEAVANALAILDAVAGTQPLSLADAARVAGVSKSTAYRLLATLEVAGLVERLTASGYRPGANAVRWAMRLLDGVPLRREALPILRSVRDATGETVNLALLRGTGLIYVEILESPSPFRMADAPGSSVAVHASALGKAVAVHLSPTQLAPLLGPEPYEALTVHTPTSWAGVSSCLSQVRSDGYATDIEEVEIGVACVAVAILSRNEVVAAISVSAPRARMSDERVAEVGRLLIGAARQVEQRLGSAGSPP